jgi:hypothetical protein
VLHPRLTCHYCQVWQQHWVCLQAVASRGPHPLHLQPCQHHRCLAACRCLGHLAVTSCSCSSCHWVGRVLFLARLALHHPLLGWVV